MPVRLANQEEPLPGYRLLERLGRGGFGEVWKVEAPGGLLKAMKFVFGDLDSAEDDGRPAEQELKALHRVKTIRHPYILSLERFDIVDGQLIIVMELADRNLWDRFRECRAKGLPGIPRDELLGYMAETAEALDLMNDQYQIQHLDVKPQNLFLVYNHVKVADFGLAKTFEGARGTVTGGVTPVYAAPETFEGWISRFTDQYSLAIVFQELLTGTRPFTGANTKQLLLQHLNGVPDLNPLPPPDRSVIGKALNKKPDERWASCAELVAHLRNAVTFGSPPSLTTGKPGPVFQSPAPQFSSPSYRPESSPIAGRSYPTSPLPAPPIPGSHSPGGMPSLVTPRLVTPQAAAGGLTPDVTAHRPAVFQTARMTALGFAPPERTADGVLFPALVIGIGGTGLTVLRTLRQMIRDQFGRPDAIATLRFLYIDTDPEAVSAATNGPDALAPREVLLTRLNRPAHYLQRDGLPPVEAWLPQGLLYQLPRNPGPAAGVRAFGRLALCDHHRVISQRLRQDIEMFLSDDTLDRTAAETRLGMRTNRARVYLVSSVAGGTGGGMVIDLAYLVKHELKQVGYRKPDVVGVLLMPPADRATIRPIALSNTFATLSEISQFGSGIRYQTRFESSEAPVVDPDGPFARTAVMQFPKAGKSSARVIGSAARVLLLEMLTPVGRVADYTRAVLPTTMPQPSGPSAFTFGLYRLSWPRSELLTASTRRFCQRLLQRWAAKDTEHLEDPIRGWLASQWTQQKLDPTSVVARLDAAIAKSLGEPAPTVFDAAVDVLRTRTPSAARFDAVGTCDVLDQLIKLVGKSDDSDNRGSLHAVVHEAAKAIGVEVETSLATVAVSFVEQPQYRLAGAEEALNQISEQLQLTLDELQATRVELANEAQELYPRLLHLIGTLDANSGHGSRRAAMLVELHDRIRMFPDKRLKLLQLDATLALYRTLMGNVPEYLREVNFCRTRLGELSQGLAAPMGPSPTSGPGMMILPEGCANLDAAADQFLSTLPADDILQFDQAVQVEVKRRFRGVVSVCLKPDRSADFLTMLTSESRGFLDVRMEHADPAGVLLRHRPTTEGIRQTLLHAYEEAAPELTTMTGTPSDSVTILAYPPGSAGEAVRDAMEDACPGVTIAPAVISQEILIYREYPHVPLDSLPQLGAPGREAYLANKGGSSPPHARADVNWPLPPSE